MFDNRGTPPQTKPRYRTFVNSEKNPSKTSRVPAGPGDGCDPRSQGQVFIGDQFPSVEVGIYFPRRIPVENA